MASDPITDPRAPNCVLLLLPAHGRQGPILPGNSAEAGGPICQRPCQLLASPWPPPSELIPWGLRQLMLTTDRSEGPAVGTCGILQLALFRHVIPHRPGLCTCCWRNHLLLPPRTCSCAHTYVHTHTRPEEVTSTSHPVASHSRWLKSSRPGLTLDFTIY